jgi:hypothetical protein
MDTRTASVIANTVGLAKWCAARADELEPLISATEIRPLSPQETRVMLRSQQELLRRVSQQQTFLAEMVFHQRAPWWVWWRATFWLVFGRRPRA